MIARLHGLYLSALHHVTPAARPLIITVSTSFVLRISKGASADFAPIEQRHLMPRVPVGVIATSQATAAGRMLSRL
jgi:hypothetical protein